MYLQENKNIAIVGHGYVGKAVDYGFSDGVNKHVIDPIYNTDISNLVGKNIDIAFVCVPTPFGKNGEIDSSIVESVVTELAQFNCPIIIKSTVTPDIVNDLYIQNKLVVYNPESNVSPFIQDKEAYAIEKLAEKYGFTGDLNSQQRMEQDELMTGEKLKEEI